MKHVTEVEWVERLYELRNEPERINIAIRARRLILQQRMPFEETRLQKATMICQMIVENKLGLDWSYEQLGEFLLRDADTYLGVKEIRHEAT